MEEQLSNEIIKRVCECGWNAYLTGGAVRDEFIEADPTDFDIVTDALPEELEMIFPDRKVKTAGASFLVTIIDGVDVATYRSDKNLGKGRFNCITEACQTLEEDLDRRDFTFNAMAVCPYTGEVIDNHNGLYDLKHKIVKFVGNPYQRIYEDELRMIRAARFACLIEGTIDPRGLNAIRNLAFAVKNISPERVRMELLKVMKYKRPSIFFDILHETGLLEILFPDLERCYGHTGGMYHDETIDVHLKLTGDKLSPKDPILRLAGYLHDIGKPLVYDGKNFIDHEKIGADMVAKLLAYYKFSNKEIDRIYGLVKLHMRPVTQLKTEKAARRLIQTLAKYNISFKDFFKLRIADKKSNLKSRGFYSREKIKSLAMTIYKETHRTESGEFKITDLPVNGFDIMNLYKIEAGPLIGKILKLLLEIVIEDITNNEREILLDILLENKEKWGQL
jgi:putative nucleotidyltransferase with HDIG domain